MSRSRSNTTNPNPKPPQPATPADADAMEFASPETLPSMVAALSSYETAETERRGHAEHLAGEADQITQELERLAQRRRELDAEAARLGALRAEKQAAEEDRRNAAQAAAAQAMDFRRILARVAPDALTDYDERKRAQAATVAALSDPLTSTITGPQNTRVAAGNPETAPMPAAHAAEGAPFPATQTSAPAAEPNRKVR